MYTSTREAIRDALRLLDQQGRKSLTPRSSANLDKPACAYMTDGGDRCGIGIILPIETARLLGCQAVSVDELDDEILLQIAPDALNDGWYLSMLQTFHDHDWNPQRGEPAEVQLKECLPQLHAYAFGEDA